MQIYLSPTLWLEAGIAIFIAVVFLWNHAEYALFAYAFALGFPDVACPLGGTINIRVDDVLIVLLLARTFWWAPAAPSRAQRSILVWQALFLALCLLSLAVETATGTLPGGYEVAKMAGCTAILLTLPRLLQSERRLQFFVAGLMCAGIAVAIQIRQHLGDGSAAGFANFQELKSAAGFTTWNPNTIGQAAILFVFAAGLGGIIFSQGMANKIFWPSLAMGFALMPALVFVRGTALSIAAGFVVYMCLLRRWLWVVVFAAACLCAVFYLHSRDPELMKDAVTVNFTTGEGFSHRFDRWGMAWQGIKKQPWLGQGFGQEMPYLTLIGSEGRAHDAYLAVWLELGVGGLMLFLGIIAQFFRGGWLLYGNALFRERGALILALTLTLCLDSVGLPTLYFEKLPTIALSVAVAVVGMCQGDDTEAAVKEVNTQNGNSVLAQPS